MQVTNYSVQENAGGWRFVGPYHDTPKKAKAFMAERKASGWPTPMKVVKIHTLDRNLPHSKNLRFIDFDIDAEIWGDFGPAPD